MKIDKEKVKANAIDAVAVTLGLGLGYAVSNFIGGKLPSKWLEPFVTLVPGIAGTILIKNDFAASMAKGVAAAGVVNGGEKIVTAVIAKVPAAAPIAKIVPKAGNLAGVRGVGDVRQSQSVLLGLSGGQQMVAALI